MATLWVRREGQALLPHSKAAALEIERMPRGVPLRAEVVRPRNGKHHRLIWQLFTYVADALNDGPTPTEWTAEDVATHVKVATGHVSPIKVKGTVAFVPKSISYDKMDQTEFGKFSDAAMQYIGGDLCPWIEQSDHWPQIVQILQASKVPA